MSDPRSPSKRTLRIRGLITVVVVILGLVVVMIKPWDRPPATTDLTVVAPSFPDALEVGTPVDMRDQTVGSVCDIDTTDPAEARLRLCLTSGDAFAELTQRSAVSVVSRNVFGNYAVRLNPSSEGEPLHGDGTLTLAEAPHDYSITATVRSAGAFTLPVLTPRLSELLNKTSDYTTRMAPFVTAVSEALQAMERSQKIPLRAVLPNLTDIVDGVGQVAVDGSSALRLISKQEDLGDRPHTQRVYAMIDSLGDMFGDTGGLLSIAGNAEPALALVTTYTDALRQSLRGVDAEDVASLIQRFGGAFQRDPQSGATRLHVGVDLGSVPSVSTPLSMLLSGGKR